MEPELLIVIVTYNSSHVVIDLLNSIPPAVAGLSTHVTVVDNGSTDGTADMLTSRIDCQLIRSTNEGYAAGINKGISGSPQSPFIMVLNPDVRLHAGSARTMVSALSDQRRGVVVPKILDSRGDLSWSLRREPTILRNLGLGRLGLPLLSEYFASEKDYLTPHVVDWALGAVLMMSRSCYQAVGCWDESYFLYSEETEFLLKARDLGFSTWFEPAAVAVHIGKGSGYSDVAHSMLAVNRVRLYRRRHQAPASWIYFVLTVARETSWLLRGQRESRAAVVSLLLPSRRPVQLHAGLSLMPT